MPVMRKIVSLLCVLCVSTMLLAQTDSTKIEGIHPYKVADEVSWEHAHWSLLPYVGVNWFMGDFTSSEIKSTMGLPSFGIAAECAFNPAWGIGFEYGYANWKVSGDPTKTNAAGARLNADTLLLGKTHKADVYLAADLINLILPFAKKKPVALMAQVGVGGAIHKNSVYYDMSESNTAGREARGATALHPEIKGAMKKYDFNPYLVFGMDLDFNINRTLAMGVRASYDLFLSDLIDNRKFNPNTDGLLEIALNLRIKFNAVKMTHARNVPGRDFPDLRAITTAEARNYVEEEVAKHIKTAYAEGAEAAKVHDTLIIQHDSVIVRDGVQYAAVPAVVAQPATNAVAEAAPESQPRVYARAAQNFYIYFDSYKAQLSEDGLITIQQVADLLKDDSTLNALIIGYCDNTGTAQANLVLGEKRAGNVEEELRAEYGIEAARLYAVSRGVVVGGRSKAAYAPNRRVAIQLVDKATFDRRKAELEEEKAKRADEQFPVMTTVTVNESTTLSQLARKYYNNTNCWIYIYAANKSKLSGPNNVVQGVELTIPEITEEDKKITKSQSQDMYREIQ